MVLVRQGWTKRRRTERGSGNAPIEQQQQSQDGQISGGDVGLLLETHKDDDDQRSGNNVVTLQKREKERIGSVHFRTTSLRNWVFVDSDVIVSYHVPNKVGQPIKERLHSTDELHVFGFVHSLLDEEDNETCGDKGHGEDHTDGNQHVDRCCHPGGDGK